MVYSFDVGTKWYPEHHPVPYNVPPRSALKAPPPCLHVVALPYATLPRPTVRLDVRMEFSYFYGDDEAEFLNWERHTSYIFDQSGYDDLEEVHIATW